MASQTNAPTRAEDADTDRIDHHLQQAMESADDAHARYHLREALQLKIAEMH